MNPTFDASLPTWDSTAYTWDTGYGIPVGAVRLSSGSTVYLWDRVNVRVSDIQFDRGMFRAPYGTVWHQEGDARQAPVEIVMDGEIVGTSISAAAVELALLRAALESASSAVTHYGLFSIVGVRSIVRTPLELGFRVVATLVTVRGYEGSA